MHPYLKRSLTTCAAALAALALSSCYVDNPGGPPYNSGYRSSPSYGSYSQYPSAYGGRPYYRDSHYDRGHDDHYNDRYRRSNDERIKLTGGGQGGKPNRPDGYHTKDWYEKRGYDLDRYKHQHEDSGRSHAGEDYRSKSSSSKGKSKSKR